jgi:hypothetical protein
MSTRLIATPMSRVRFGLARVDITPPVGIYHRVWGAAKHERATGVHRALYADVMAFAPAEDGGLPLVRIQTDLVGLVQEQFDALCQALSEGLDLPHERILLAFSHSHAAGWFVPDRLGLPGGELIPTYLATLQDRLLAGGRLALAGMEEASIEYATGSCKMAASRDYWDDEAQLYACGLSPDTPADDTMLVGRITYADSRAAEPRGRLCATLVHYACHPTTLAYQNTLLSPDFIGAARETVEHATAAPCVYLQGPCGDLAPREGYTGDVAMADRNGRQLGYAALAALESIGPAVTDYAYQGPLVSGATLGIWEHVPRSAERLEQASRMAGGSFMVDLPLKPQANAATWEAKQALWTQREREAEARGDAIAARDARALAERAKRWLARLQERPAGDTYALSYSVYRLGDAAWVTTGGEPFSLLQQGLRKRFPHLAILPSPLAGNMQVAYILPAARYGAGLYQEEVASLGPGGLELLIDAISRRITELF